MNPNQFKQKKLTLYVEVIQGQSKSQTSQSQWSTQVSGEILTHGGSKMGNLAVSFWLNMDQSQGNLWLYHRATRGLLWVVENVVNKPTNRNDM